MDCFVRCRFPNPDKRSGINPRPLHYCFSKRRDLSRTKQIISVRLSERRGRKVTTISFYAGAFFISLISFDWFSRTIVPRGGFRRAFRPIALLKICKQLSVRIKKCRRHRQPCGFGHQRQISYKKKARFGFEMGLVLRGGVVFTTRAHFLFRWFGIHHHRLNSVMAYG